MKNSAFLSTLLAFLILTGCSNEYVQVAKPDLDSVFAINSSPTFLGYFYEGSDDEFHYFSSRWKYGSDRKMKIARTDLEVDGEFDFGTSELGLSVIRTPDPGPVFCEIDGRSIYRIQTNE